ncbi:MAG: carbamate kinase [Prolixibacteraceae bacterium]|jgi:carbamate kinase|nr:carbamate kinase [Prolixibacteraceae bacterium]
MKKLAVVALGGNALLRDTEQGTIEQQEVHTSETIESLLFLVREDYDLIITHGNGPQVGNILMRNDAGEQVYGIPQMPLDICVADSQGGIGYMIERIFRNILSKYKIERNVVTLVGMVEVDPEDPAFSNPTKRIGATYNFEQAKALEKQKGWSFKESKKSGNGWRRVVPSPVPKNILNLELIRDLARKGNIVITCGGGGIPIFFDSGNNLRTVDAVIDKDLASSVLASGVGADEFYILTDVSFIYKDFGLPTQEKLEFLDYRDTKRYLELGTFGEGSMAPKIVAAMKFVERGGIKSIITEASKLEDKSFGSKITLKYNS